MILIIHEMYWMDNFFKLGEKMNLLNPINLKERTDYLILYIPSFVISILIAETFFKFYSFTLELLAFLVTWYGVFVLTRILLKLTHRSQDTE